MNMGLTGYTRLTRHALTSFGLGAWPLLWLLLGCKGREMNGPDWETDNVDSRLLNRALHGD